MKPDETDYLKDVKKTTSACFLENKKQYSVYFQMSGLGYRLYAFVIVSQYYFGLNWIANTIFIKMLQPICYVTIHFSISFSYSTTRIKKDMFHEVNNNLKPVR